MIQIRNSLMLIGILGLQTLGSTSALANSTPCPDPTVAAGSIFCSQAYYDAVVKAARNKGLAQGYNEAASSCLAEPKTCGCIYGLIPCGISIQALLTTARYGETEPNDNLITADPMVPDKIYWGQSMSLQDQDWFYVTTQEVNQIINLTFLVPDAKVTNDLAGWDISVRDAAGTILADFPSYIAISTGGVHYINEINYPVFVSFAGTYYIVIQHDPISTDINSLPYNLIANISFSDSDTPPIDATTFDTETEPNNTYAAANPVRSTVAMYGMLSSTLVGNTSVGWALQTDEDWFWYNSPGHEIAALAWCQREDCAPTTGLAWRVTVQASDGTMVTSFSTADIKIGGTESFNAGTYRTQYIGLDKPGKYFIQVMSELQKNPNGNIVTTCRQWNTPQPGQAAVCLSYAPLATVTTDQYNFTWQGTSLPPNTGH